MIQYLKKYISPTHPLRLFYHKLWGIAAAVSYGFPGRKLTVIGITGTDGKTTTAEMTYEILTQAGYKTGLCSTVEFAIGKHRFRNTTHKTTVGRFGLQKMLRRMEKAKCTHVVIETSSHALKQHRTWGISYDIATITNISPEHLDFHGDIENYRETKGKLLKNLKSGKKKGIAKIAVLNKDDEHFHYFDSYDLDNKLSFGFHNKADITAKRIHLTSEYSEFDLYISDECIPIKINIPGDFNIQNALAASSIAHSLHIPLKKIKEGLENITFVPGRMEKVDEGQPFDVIVDFAMTERGYENVLSFLKKTVKNHLWVIFGCCGERDKQKRAGIGKIAMKYCDRVVITDDEPYHEDPKHIRDMTEAGVKESGGKLETNYFIIPDRKKAFEFAIKNAKKGDSILVPGMGDFEGRTIMGKVVPWSDRKVLQKILSELKNTN